MTEEPKKKPRGFAAMSPERRRAIARKGGYRASELGKAHRWNSEEARAASLAGHANKPPQPET